MVSGTPELLFEQGRTAKKERRLQEATALFRKALTESQTSEDRSLRAVLYEELAYVERNLRELEAAEAHYRQASEIYRSLDNHLKSAHTVRHAADILLEQKKLDEAEPLYAESLEIYRRRKDVPPLDLANAIRGFALLKEQAGDREEALSLWREAGKLYESTGIDAGVEESKRRIGLLMGE